MPMTSWLKMIKDEIPGEKIIHCTLSSEQLAEEFETGTKEEIQGPAFTAWSKSWVLFPVFINGAESVGKAPRNPCGTITEHIGK